MRTSGSTRPQAAWRANALFSIVAALVTSTMLAAQAIPGQKTFSSPTEAAKAMFDGARSGDPTALVPIIGQATVGVISSGVLGDSKEVLSGFVDAYTVKHWLSIEAQGYQVLEVGKNDWPFPFPIVRDGTIWYFDIGRGEEEILDRRLGRNELGAIAVCEGYVQSQIEYAAKGHDGNPSGIYAQKLHSDEGKQNGLYWAVTKGQPQSPMGPLVTSAAAEGHSAESSESPAPYHGYFYKILTAQGPDTPGAAKNYIVDGKMTGGFALIAYPAEYGKSGVMTFLVNQDGDVYQKDLGEQTDEVASQITSYNRDSSWQPTQ
jgi:Protein of unknown function (DUF2950)